MSLELPKISIITPSYNQADFIEETILSVLEQGYPRLEYFVMDGGSNDGTVDILKKYGKHIQWISQKDRGQSDAINRGFRRASGEILAYINSDDRYEPGALLAVGEYLREHPQAFWVTGKCRNIDPQGHEVRKLVREYKNFWLSLRSYKILLVIDYISQPATFWRRLVIDQIGFFDESLHFTMDYDYSLRVGRLFKLWVVDSYLASFRIQPGSKSRRFRDHFNADLETARRYTNSKLVYDLHRLHNAMIVCIYNGWQ